MNEKNNTVEKVLQIIDRCMPHGESWKDDEFSIGWVRALNTVRERVEGLKDD